MSAIIADAMSHKNSFFFFHKVTPFEQVSLPSRGLSFPHVSQVRLDMLSPYGLSLSARILSLKQQIASRIFICRKIGSRRTVELTRRRESKHPSPHQAS